VARHRKKRRGVIGAGRLGLNREGYRTGRGLSHQKTKSDGAYVRNPSSCREGRERTKKPNSHRGKGGGKEAAAS